MKNLYSIFLIFISVNVLSANDSIHVELGIPVSTNSTTKVLIQRSQYWVNYKPMLGNPEWVAWNLNKDWYGDVERYSGNFITDTSLPVEWRIKHDDYTNSGYDRGHMVRSEERTQTVADNKATFIMTNIIPQTPELNRNTWLDFERYCEKLCKEQDKELYIYSGPQYNANPSKINDKVLIPDSCYKIVVIMNRGEGVEQVNDNTPIVAVMMPNNVDVKQHEWSEYQRTVRTIEKSTGIDFLTRIPQPIQDVIENKLITSVQDNVTTTLSVYPNPATDFINVTGIGNYTIYDIYGMAIGIYHDGKIDISNLPSGIYLLKSGNEFVKVVKI